jgi:hypothetical protein
MYPKSWQRNLWEAVALLLAVAIAAHFVWDELEGLLPVLMALLVLAVVYTLVLRGWWR